MNGEAKIAIGTESDDAMIARMLANELESLSFRRTASLDRACSHLLSTRGGHLRGRLLLAAAALGQDPATPTVRRAACAVELLHLATLAHDDIVDTEVERRGVPSANALFGQRTVAFAGAWIFARASELITDCGSAALTRFADASGKMCEGGMLELRGLYDTSRTTDDCIEEAIRKTAVGFSLAAWLGGELAGANRSMTEQLDRFGRELGIAYQIWDDVADLMGNSKSGDRSSVKDLRQGLYNLPVVYAMDESSELRELLIDFGASVEEQEAAITLITDTRGPSRALEVAEMFAARAATALHDVGNAEPLHRLIDEARSRQMGRA